MVDLIALAVMGIALTAWVFSTAALQPIPATRKRKKSRR